MIKLTTSGKIILNDKETNFLAQEFVPPEVYNSPRNTLHYLNENLVFLVQFCRDWWGVPVYLNDWHRGGTRDLAGYRTPETGIIDYLLEYGISPDDSKTIQAHLLSIKTNTSEEITLGSWWSQHKFIRAADPIFKGITADQIRTEILDNEKSFISAGLTTLEAGRYAPTWVHMDQRPTGIDNILIVGI